MIIRKANCADISAIVEIEKDCFSTPWSYDSIKSSFNNSSNSFYIAELDGEAASYMGLSVILDEGYILNVATLHSYRRQGLAKALLTYVINIYEKDLSFLTLEVRPSNTAAIKFYKGFGFEQVGKRKAYYRNPTEDALLLTKTFRNKEK